MTAQINNVAKAGREGGMKGKQNWKKGRARIHLLLYSVLITELQPITPSQTQPSHLIDLPSEAIN